MIYVLIFFPMIQTSFPFIAYCFYGRTKDLLNLIEMSGNKFHDSSKCFTWNIPSDILNWHSLLTPNYLYGLSYLLMFSPTIPLKFHSPLIIFRSNQVKAWSNQNSKGSFLISKNVSRETFRFSIKIKSKSFAGQYGRFINIQRYF